MGCFVSATCFPQPHVCVSYMQSHAWWSNGYLEIPKAFGCFCWIIRIFDFKKKWVSQPSCRCFLPILLSEPYPGCKLECPFARHVHSPFCKEYITTVCWLKYLQIWLHAFAACTWSKSCDSGVCMCLIHCQLILLRSRVYIYPSRKFS